MIGKSSIFKQKPINRGIYEFINKKPENKLENKLENNVIEEKKVNNNENNEIMNEKLIALLQKVDGIDEILLDLKEKQNNLITNVTKYQNDNNTLLNSQKLQPLVIPYQKYVEDVPKKNDDNNYIQKKEIQEIKNISIKKPKKVYQKMTRDMAIEKLKIYPNFPEDLLDNIYTFNGEDVYLAEKNKKIPIIK
jgi:hypothetical protein